MFLANVLLDFGEIRLSSIHQLEQLSWLPISPQAFGGPLNSPVPEEPTLESWLKDEWPSLLSRFGIPAKVFFSLTRYLYQLQKQTENRVSVPPAWEFHIIFGTEFCRELHWTETQYSEVLDELSKTKHAHIDSSQWVLPEHSFLLETDSIPEIDLELPSAIWFSRHSLRLPSELRQTLATAYALIEGDHVDDIHDKTPLLTSDFDWLLGSGIGLTMHARDMDDQERARMLLRKSENFLRAGIEIASESRIWSALSYCTYQQAIQEDDVAAKLKSAERAVESARKSIDHDRENDSAWIRLGVSLGIMADHSDQHAQQRSLREEEIAAYEQAIAIDRHDDSYWFNLGSAFGQLAKIETDHEAAQALQQKNLEALQTAVDANPKNHWAWISLGLRYQEMAERESNEQEKSFLILKAVSANRRAIDVDRNTAAAWQNLASSLNGLGDLSNDLGRLAEIRTEQFQASETAVKIAPQDVVSWTNLGTAAHRLAESEVGMAPHEMVNDLRLQSISAFRSALDLEKLNPMIWFQMANVFHELTRFESTLESKVEYSHCQIEALKMTVQLEPQFVSGWINLGHAFRLAPSSHLEEQFAQLEEAIRAYQSAIDLDPENSIAWANVGWTHAEIARTREESFDSSSYRMSEEAFENAIRFHQDNDFALSNLAIHFGERFRVEDTPELRTDFARRAMDLFEAATVANPHSFSTWFNYCFFLGAVRDSHDSIAMSRESLFEKQLHAAHQSVELEPQNENAWLMLGLSLGQAADAAKRLTEAVDFNQRSIESYRAAIEIDANYFPAWSSLGIRLIYLWQIENDESYRLEAIEASDRSIQNNEGHYNAACVYALAGETEKAMQQLDYVLENEHVPLEHVQSDPDLKPLWDHPEFQLLLDRFGT